jgi:hypothetical protein
MIGVLCFSFEGCIEYNHYYSNGFMYCDCIKWDPSYEGSLETLGDIPLYY